MADADMSQGLLHPRDYPKVLIVNTLPICRSWPPGITMLNLFRDWPRDRIAQLHIEDPVSEPVAYPTTRRIALRDRRLPGFIRQLIIDDQRTTQSRAAEPERSRVQRAGLSVLCTRARHRVLSELELAAPFASKDLGAWIADFKPDVVYTILEDYRAIDVVYDIARYFHVPVAPHFMDDWIVTTFRGRRHRGSAGRRALGKALSIMRAAKVRLAIGKDMAEEYERRYGLSFIPVMNCVDRYRQNGPSEPRTTEPVHFAYRGGFHHGRATLLREIGLALSELQTEGIKGEVVLFSSSIADAGYGELIRSPHVRVATARELEAFETHEAPIDALLHVDSFDPGAIDYLRFSMSAKLPWCMAAGRPILAYGPSELATIRYIRESGFGVVVDRQDRRLLGEALSRLAKDYVLRATLGDRALAVARANHDGSVVRERFRAALARAAAIGESRTGRGASGRGA